MLQPEVVLLTVNKVRWEVTMFEMSMIFHLRLPLSSLSIQLKETPVGLGHRQGCPQ